MRASSRRENETQSGLLVVCQLVCPSILGTFDASKLMDA